MTDLLGRIEKKSQEVGLKLNKNKCALLIVDSAKGLSPLNIIKNVQVKTEVIL